MYIFVDFNESVPKKFHKFYPEVIFSPKFKKIRWLTELTTLNTDTQTDRVDRLFVVMLVMWKHWFSCLMPSLRLLHEIPC